MSVDLHSHTPRCRHAVGEPRSYVERAIASNVAVYGFSDHAPMEFDEGYRMGFGEMDDYERDVLELKAEFADKIDIRLAYEVDWLPGYIDKRIFERDVDYLIGSVHFIGGWGFDNPEFIGDYKGKNIDEIWREYFRLMGEMAESRLFDIVGHMDLIKIFNFMPNVDARELAMPTLEKIAKSGMSIELNAAGIRKPVKEAYPSMPILQTAREMGITITFGSDAHMPEQVGFERQTLLGLARDAGYTECAAYRGRKKEMVPIV